MTRLGWNAGGTSIEDLAEKFPDKIVKVPVEIREGITDAQARPLPYPTLFCPVIPTAQSRMSGSAVLLAQIC